MLNYTWFGLSLVCEWFDIDLGIRSCLNGQSGPKYFLFYREWIPLLINIMSKMLTEKKKIHVLKSKNGFLFCQER